MRAACQFNARLLDAVRPCVVPGATTESIDRFVHEYTLDHGHTPACLGYQGERGPFPKSCCTSVNDVICHGIPDSYELQPGDIVNVDLTTIVNGWFGDQSETFLIGEVSDTARAVTQCSFDSLYLAIDALTPDCKIAVIGEAIVKEAAKYGFGVVDKYVGHGIGRRFHQPPNIPHVPSSDTYRKRLSPGMCFTIEPMINAGSGEAGNTERDGWTVRTVDRQLSAQFEHTILMTEDGPEILTLTQLGPAKGHKF
ncbi:MAG: type I methionyl aminopeptidase [Planctomycetales bacterium]|nr:type I methionyl aminopeptidase [Planctomycetales bacterium]